MAQPMASRTFPPPSLRDADPHPHQPHLGGEDPPLPGQHGQRPWAHEVPGAGGGAGQPLPLRGDQGIVQGGRSQVIVVKEARVMTMVMKSEVYPWQRYFPITECEDGN